MGFVCRQNAGHISLLVFCPFYRQQIKLWSRSGAILCKFLNSCTVNATRMFYLQIFGFFHRTASLLIDLTPQILSVNSNEASNKFVKYLFRKEPPTQHFSFDWQSFPSFKNFGFGFCSGFFEAWWLICSAMAQNESFRIFFAVLVSALLFWRTFGIFYLNEKNFSINISRAVEQFSDGMRLPTKCWTHISYEFFPILPTADWNLIRIRNNSFHISIFVHW